MKLFSSVVVSLLFFFSLGCKPILLKIEGIRQPKLENHQSLSKFLLSCRVDTSEILCFKDTFALNKFYATDIAFPDARFFNKEKKLVDYRSLESDCNAKVSPFIEKIGSINKLTPVPAKTLDEFIKDLVVVQNAQKFILEDQEYDAYMIIYWAKYLGKVTKSHISEWQELVNKGNKGSKKTRVILVNLDYQSFWGIKSSDLPKLSY